MKAITISTDSVIEVIDVPSNGAPLYEQIRKAVNGHMENVYPRRLPAGYVMVVNEEGRLINLPENPIGSYLYQTDIHGEPIVGNVIILKLGYYDCEPDVVGMTDADVAKIKEILSKFIVIKE